ncbi:MAG: DUF499 domain-containing protein [Archangium sp.]|nr:DUF499 domain-containing protein [Archangium sp.]
MKPWREVAVPHKDVLQGTFQQSEFAADLSAVRANRATPEYQDAAQFFERTFITEGMRLLLTQVARRLNGQGGEPVIQLQTAFGGGKTHTMLAVFHLATRSKSIKDLAGVPAVLDAAGLMDVPKANIAILDGNAHAPGQPWSHGKTKIHTLWGELAWQLGGDDGLGLVRESDATGTSPGKETLRSVLEKFAPCVVLVDELVAYIRQFPDGKNLSGGSYDSNLSFIQALTEAVKLVPNAVLLGSLPESEVEAGGSRGLEVLRSLEKTFGRVQALWKPVATEEAFEIVRRRLFEPIRDEASRDAAVRAFAKLYEEEGSKVPSVTHEARYAERMRAAYPIHPEVFDRLYEDWTTLQGFQRTRGVLKLMAQVIHRLWADGNKDLLILPGSLPLDDTKARSELTYYLPTGWDAVVDRDIDGKGSEPYELDQTDTRFGKELAARRVTRTLFLATSPASNGLHKGTKGIDRARVVLGCIQPGQTSALFGDALSRLADRLHYLNASGDKNSEATRYWFDTRATLRREMEDRRNQLEGQPEVLDLMKSVLEKVSKGSQLFDGVHVFTPHADVPDDGALRLVVLRPDQPYSKQDKAAATEQVAQFIRNNGSKPRYRSNRILFIAAEQSSLDRLRVAIRTALAWESIVDDIDGRRLTVDRPQEDQAKKELETARATLPRFARETFKWLLCPQMATSTEREAQVEVYPLNAGATSFSAEVDRVCEENELVISKWAPVHLRSRLAELYWKTDKPHAGALAVWSDMEKYLYLPRLRNRAVFEKAVELGLASTDFFGAAYGEKAGSYEGLKLGEGGAQVDDALLLVEPSVAAKQKASRLAESAAQVKAAPTTRGTPAKGSGAVAAAVKAGGTPAPEAPNAANRYFATVEIKPGLAKLQLVTLAEEILKLLVEDPNSTVSINVEVSADFPKGASPQLKRAVSENVTQLKMLTFKNSNWE